MSKANTKQQSLWVVYDFEEDMFKRTLLLSAGECNKFPHPIPNAIVESMLLHLRILVDILLSRGSGNDDINLTDLLPGFKSPLVDLLKTTYRSSKKVGSPCWNLNKRLAHPTQVRSSSYNYSPLLKDLAPVVLRLLDHIAQARRVSP
jgi:hypothetical protein